MRKAVLHLAVLVFGAVSILFSMFLVQPYTCLAEGEKWPGVDESVIEKYAKEHGREARPPIINSDQGDLLLFVFLLAGAVGGFAAGYYWRTLLNQKETVIPGEGQSQT